MASHTKGDGGVEKRDGTEAGPARAGVAGWKFVVVPMAILASFFAVDLAADLYAGVSPMHLGLDVVALCVALLGLGGALRRR